MNAWSINTIANRQSRPYVDSLTIAASIDRTGVRPLLSAHQTATSNAIAAHKDALEGLLVNLLGNTAVSGIGFVALLDAYITRLDTNCADISARVSPPPAQINGELIQLGALRLHPDWDPLRNDQRFEKIVASLAPQKR